MYTRRDFIATLGEITFHLFGLKIPNGSFDCGKINLADVEIAVSTAKTFGFIFGIEDAAVFFLSGASSRFRAFGSLISGLCFRLSIFSRWPACRLSGKVSEAHGAES